MTFFTLRRTPTMTFEMFYRPICAIFIGMFLFGMTYLALSWDTKGPRAAAAPLTSPLPTPRPLTLGDDA
jgi:hypothetical protein